MKTSPRTIESFLPIPSASSAATRVLRPAPSAKIATNHSLYLVSAACGVSLYSSFMNSSDPATIPV